MSIPVYMQIQSFPCHEAALERYILQLIQQNVNAFFIYHWTFVDMQNLHRGAENGVYKCVNILCNYLHKMLQGSSLVTSLPSWSSSRTTFSHQTINLVPAKHNTLLPYIAQQLYNYDDDVCQVIAWLRKLYISHNMTLFRNECTLRTCVSPMQ